VAQIAVGGGGGRVRGPDGGRVRVGFASTRCDTGRRSHAHIRDRSCDCCRPLGHDRRRRAHIVVGASGSESARVVSRGDAIFDCAPRRGPPSTFPAQRRQKTTTTMTMMSGASAGRATGAWTRRRPAVADPRRAGREALFGCVPRCRCRRRHHRRLLVRPVLFPFSRPRDPVSRAKTDRGKAAEEDTPRELSRSRVSTLSGPARSP